MCYEEGEQQGQRVVLGTGGFGRVELVRDGPRAPCPVLLRPAVPPGAAWCRPVPPGAHGARAQVRCRERLFALKRIRKDWVVRTRQQEHVRTERRVLAGSSSPFVVG